MEAKDIVDVGSIDTFELIKYIDKLNDSGHLANKIKIENKSKEELIIAFIEGACSIPDDVNGEWLGPQDALIYYSSIIKNKEPEPARIVKEIEIKEFKGKSKVSDRTPSEFGHRFGTVAYDVDIALRQGVSRKAILNLIKTKYGKSRRIAESLFRVHMNKLRKNYGVTIVFNKSRYRIADSKKEEQNE